MCKLSGGHLKNERLKIEHAAYVFEDMKSPFKVEATLPITLIQIKANTPEKGAAYFGSMGMCALCPISGMGKPFLKTIFQSRKAQKPLRKERYK